MSQQTRQGTIRGGMILLIVGVLVTVGTMAASAGGGSYVIAWGAIIVGLVRVVRGYSMPADPSLHVNEDQLVGRFGPDDPTPQLAGASCVHCQEKITSALEAMACKVCNKPVHFDCKKEHKADAHSEKQTRAAYR